MIAAASAPSAMTTADCASAYLSPSASGSTEYIGYESESRCHDSAQVMMFVCMPTDVSGYWPLADSPESITASACSSTAFVTSETSARVGRGFFCIDSSICVATITGLPASTQRRTISFCHVVTCQMSTSTPRSPRATMMPSEDSTISSRLSSASVVSTLEMILGGGVFFGSGQYFSWHSAMYARMFSTPAAERTNEAATQ